MDQGHRRCWQSEATGHSQRQILNIVPDAKLTNLALKVVRSIQLLIMHAKTACHYERNSLWHALLSVAGVLWRYGRWLARANALCERTPQSPLSVSTRRFAVRCCCLAASAVTSSLAPLGSHTHRAVPGGCSGGAAAHSTGQRASHAASSARVQSEQQR